MKESLKRLNSKRRGPAGSGKPFRAVNAPLKDDEAAAREGDGPSDDTSK
jgi:hypothetical protein